MYDKSKCKVNKSEGDGNFIRDEYGFDERAEHHEKRQAPT